MAKEYKVLKDFGDVKVGDILTTDSWTDEERAIRLEDGTIECITADDETHTDTPELDKNGDPIVGNNE